jgi:glucuronoarabinoxylan endo-1,4-beta-xylanase
MDEMMRHIYKRTMLALTSLAFGWITAYGQSYTVNGTVTASGNPVRYALVTFFDSYDFSKQYSALTDSSGTFSLGKITFLKYRNQTPDNFHLDQNYPNPFSSSTTISYGLNKESNVKVTIYDVLGREIRTFHVGLQSVGPHGVVWDGRNDFGRTVAPGVYFYRLQAQGETQVKKMLFGVNANPSSVFLPGVSSPQANLGGSAISVPSKPFSGGESFVVSISNTDSTSPVIVERQIGNIVVQSDTTFNFTVSLPQVIVYLDSTRQIMRGFGGANVAIFGRPYMTQAQVLTAFGNGNGQIGMTIMRLSIPTDSTQFSQYAASALSAQNLGAAIIATPWTPPAWMKSNNSISGGYLLPNNYAAYAAHLKAFADTMLNHGVSLYAISVQNEPDYNASYESCLWNATQFMNFMRYYAPSVGVPVFMPESATFSHQLSDSTLNDSLASSHVAFIGGHIYGVQPTSYPLALEKGKEIWMTEYLINSGSSTYNSLDTGWSGALQTAKSINDCMMSNMSAYVWWYIVRYYGPIDENGNVTKKGYVMSQYAKFVRPGFYRVAATSTPLPNVYVTAYKDGSKIVIVALNMGSTSATLPFILQNGTATSFTPYVTSAVKNCLQGTSIPVSGSSFTATLDPSSVTTFVSN